MRSLEDKIKFMLFIILLTHIKQLSLSTNSCPICLNDTFCSALQSSDFYSWLKNWPWMKASIENG